MLNNVFEAHLNDGLKVTHQIYSNDFQIYDKNE